MSHHNNNVTSQIESLKGLTLAQLRDRWNEVFSAPPPAAARQDYLVRALANRVQEQIGGSLAPSTQRRLAKLMADGAAKENSTQPARTNLKPGSRLLREWQGTTHEVAVVEGGFAYRAKTYKSLSEIARLITGTRWSGPLFFGLKSLGKGTESVGQDRTFVVDLRCKTPSVVKRQKPSATTEGVRP
jgi:plastocyanin